MPSIESFRTKRGVAAFRDDALEFDESVRTYVRWLYRDYWKSDSRWRKALFVGFALWPVFALGWLVSALSDGRVSLVAGVCALVVVLWVIGYVRGFRSPDRLPLDRIERVDATRGEKGLTRPRLVLTYRENGAIRKRRVNLPSLYTPTGERTFERAIKAFRERGFDVE